MIKRYWVQKHFQSQIRDQKILAEKRFNNILIQKSQIQKIWVQKHWDHYFSQFFVQKTLDLEKIFVQKRILGPILGLQKFGSKNILSPKIF